MKSAPARGSIRSRALWFLPCAALVLPLILAPPSGGADVFSDSSLAAPGLVGSYVDSSLDSVTAADDWRSSQTICGTRIDTDFARGTAGWGARAEVGVTGGTDADWDHFSVQWDGYLKVTESGQRFATASDDGSRMWIDVDRNGVFGPDELLNNGWGRIQGLTVGERSPPLLAGVVPIRIQYCERSGENRFHLVSSSWVPRQFAPSVGNPRQTVRALVLNFDPRIPSEGNRRLWEIFGWNDPRMLARQFEADLEFATGGAIDVQIVQWRDLDEFPLFSDGFRYSPDQYVANRRAGSGWHDGGADFYHLARQQNLASLVNSNLIDEVWCFGDHFFALFGEAWMAGPNSFFINGPSFPDTGFDRAIAGYGFNYERGVAEMIHNLCHRTENHGQRAFGGWNLANPATAFDRFSANYLESPGSFFGVGTCHVPANADSHYDYGNERVVGTTAFDWPNYPDLTSTATPVGRDTWAFGPAPDYQRDYLDFYFGMMPRNAGAAPDGRQANWFKYIWDFNSYEAGTGLPRNEDAFGAGATIRSAGGAAHEFTVRYYDQTGVDAATIDSGDVEVRGPAGFTQIATLAGIGAETATTAGTARTATYRITPPGGSWDASDGGRYRIFLQTGQVRDTAGNDFPAGDIGSFLVLLNDPAAIDIRSMLSNGQAAATHTTFDIGAIGNLFDGSVETLVRTPNIDPMVVTIVFAQPQTIRGVRACFTATWGDPAYRWQVETADTIEDLDGQTGSWQKAVPSIGTASDQYSEAKFATPIQFQVARLTATRLTGDDYVHACEWQLIGPPLSDTNPPAASGASPSVERPGGTSHFVQADYTDATAVDVASLRTGNIEVAGPNGFHANATFYDVDTYFNGTPRAATYWFIPPGGLWDSTLNGLYTCTLLAGQIHDTLGNSKASNQILGTFTVKIPPPVRRPAHDLTESNAVDWLAGADQATASTSDDASQKILGGASVRFDTTGGFDTWLRFPPVQAADWDLSSASNLFFSVLAENDDTFQENSPWIQLRDPQGGYFEYRCFKNGNPIDPLNSALNTWQSFTVPLRAADSVQNGWRRTTVGSPSLEHIASLEFHADTWGNGFTLWWDRVGFDLPVRVLESGFGLFDGESRLWLRFDESVAATLAPSDLELTRTTTGVPVPPAAMALDYAAPSNTAFITFPGLESARLENGLFRLVLPADAVADPAGNTLSAAYSWEFRALDGDIDADNDGMAGTWERAHGFLPDDPADALSDADSDGQSNRNEYRSGTDPRDKASRLVITSASAVAARLDIMWQTVPGQRYWIQWSSDLTDWEAISEGGQPVIVDAASSGSSTRYEVPHSGSQPASGFYCRVQALPR